MLEHGLSALATLWLQSGFVALCGLVMSRFVQARSATLAATVLRATWIGVALCLVLSAASLGSAQSHRALWNVALPTTSLQTTSAPMGSVSTASEPTTKSVTATSPEFLPSTSLQTTTAATEPNFPDTSASSSTRSSTEADDRARVQTPALSSVVTLPVATPLPKKPLPIYSVLLVLWLAGSAVLLLWMIFWAWQMRRVVRTSTRIEDVAPRDVLRDLCALLRVREPLLLCSDLACSPFLTGLLRPCIVLPRGDFGTAQRFVLLHELTHLQRRDLWWNAISRVLCAVLWAQPLLWMLQRASERIGEEVCDETVVSRGESARQYAQCLLDLAQSWNPSRGERTIGAGVVPLRSGLARRIQNILDESRRRTMSVSRRARWVIGVSMLGIVAASLSLVEVQANPTVSTKSSTRKVDLSSPEAAVRSFASALSAKDLDAAARYVEGGAPVVNSGLRTVIKTGEFSVATSDFKTQIAGTTATVTFHEAETNPKNLNGDLKTKVRRTTLSLRKNNGAWKIVSAVPGRSGPSVSLLQEVTDLLSPRFKSKITAWAKNRGKASIEGRVVDDNGRPVPNARIHLTMISEDILRPLGGRDTVYAAEIMNIEPQVRALFNQYVQTKSDGTFRVNGLTSALYDLSLLPIPERRILRLISAGSLHIAAREGSSTQTPHLKMFTGVPVSVRVVESTTRKPLAGVELALNAIRNKKQVFWTSGKTDANGRVSLVSLRGRSHVMLKFDYIKRLNGLYVVSNGVPYLPLPKAGDKAPRPINNTYAEGQSVLVNRSKPNEVVFELQRYVTPKTAATSTVRSPNAGAAPIRGRVIYADGRPAVGVRVMLQPTDQAASSKEYQASRKPHIQAVERLLTQEGGKLTSRQTLNRLFDISRKFGDADITRADGTYRLATLEGTRFDVSVDTSDEIYVNPPPGTLPDWVAAAAQSTAPKAGATVRIADMVLTRGAIIRGRVLDRATGKPLVSVYVASHGPQNPRSGAAVTTAYTDAQGRYAMRVAPGTSYVYIAGSTSIKAKVHFQGAGALVNRYEQNLSVLKRGKNLYHADGLLEVRLDNAVPRSMYAGPSSNLVEVPTRLGQARTLDFLLNKLIVKRNGSVPDVYIAGKPS